MLNSLQAEAWGILRGLQIAWEKGIRKVELSTDSRDIIEWFTSQSNRRIHAGPTSNIMSKCESMRRRPWEIKAYYIYREQNRVANTLAKFVGCSIVLRHGFRIKWWMTLWMSLTPVVSLWKISSFLPGCPLPTFSNSLQGFNFFGT